MITIHKSKTADTRTCDFANVSKQQLIDSSLQHIGDVVKGMDFISNMIHRVGILHDPDKLTGIDQFHSDFTTGFKTTAWWDNHRKITRHHLLTPDGVPVDVNLVDVIEMVVDCVMAGMGRSGSVYPLKITPEVLQAAVDNTVELLKKQIIVED